MSCRLPRKNDLQAGMALLGRPLLPLIRLLPLLYLAGPFARISELLAELNEPITTAGIDYPQPSAALAPYLDLLNALEELKPPPGPGPTAETEPMAGSQAGEQGPVPPVLTEDGRTLSGLEALECRICQAVLERELETINSLLCAPCRCDLCCIGPEPDMSQDFFEIPLIQDEVRLFPLPQFDTAQSRQMTSAGEPPLLRDDRPFYQTPAALYHWRQGWSLILPPGSRCPQLAADGACRIYPKRPQVCRRPQVFAYLLAKQEASAPTSTADDAPTTTPLIAHHKLLAVWDCPYVQVLQEEIAAYAQACGLEPIFRRNKA